MLAIAPAMAGTLVGAPDGAPEGAVAGTSCVSPLLCGDGADAGQ